MAMFQASRSAAGSGGGLVITGWRTQLQTQSENFGESEVTISLAETPISDESVIIDYNGQVLHLNSDWEWAGPSTITILFGDPYVTDYDQVPVFQVVYPY